MPQITLEYSANIIIKDFKELPLGLHQIIAEMLSAEISSCKTRIVKHSNYVIGCDSKDHAFIHLSIRILKGRMEEIKNFTAHAAANYLRKNFAELYFYFRVADFCRNWRVTNICKSIEV